ncbi:MAG: ThuA domain-containing protein [Geminicoccaceae bacterium]|jgi:trehalose utilization protein|nr:ThuA domain-containing protein [Geminicoccaceae bacterium]
MSREPRVTVWNEFRHEQANPKVAEIYPRGIHEALAGPLRAVGLEVATATLDEPEHGLDRRRLDATDVLVWWGHRAHDEVADEVVQRVHQRVLDGMGLVALHSAHFSKIFKTLMGTGCDLKWREAGERERLWVVDPTHPIVAGLPEQIVIEHEEMYGEHFDIPPPDELFLVSWFRGGEVFRSGCTWRRGQGRIAYLRPGHETYPTYHNAQIQMLILNAVRWAAPVGAATPRRGNQQPQEELG